MFKNQYFYHKHIKKAIIVFGSVFNNISIERKNSSGTTVQTLRVPLAYSPKEKFLSRIRAIPDIESRGEVAITLPRMGFEITGINFDPARKLSPVQKNVKSGSDGSNNYSRTFVSTPYDMTVGLYVFAKNQEDALQVVEQIMPYFNPDFSVTINDLPELAIKRDIKITMDSVTFEDDYDGDYASRRSIIWTMNFTVKLNFYGSVGDQGYITKVISQAFENLGPDTTGPKITQTVEVGTTLPTATATISSGSVNAINITYGGAGYTSAPNITLTGNARAHAEITDGVVTNIVIDDAGSGYSSAPTVTFENPPNFEANPDKDDPHRFIEEFDQSFE